MDKFAEAWINLTKAGLDGCRSFQEQWLALLMGGMSGPDGSFGEAPMKDFFRLWGEFYEKGLRQFITVPPVGLTRYYQERVAELLDKFNQFQTKMAEFLSLLVLPMERSLKGVHDAEEPLSKNGESSRNAHGPYQAWVKMLEGSYITLFNSDEYTRTMSGTMEALEEFTVARQRFVEAVLRISFIPTSTDFDDLAREVYLLKKRVKELTRKIEERQPGPASQTRPPDSES
jgi:polyhydroxyalkanoate synthase subunit PhaE